MADNDVWTIKAALDWTVGYLQRKGDANPRVSAEWLLSEATGLRRIELYTNLERPLSLDERDVLRGYVTRRGKGEPLQYITGEVGFRHIAVKVRPGVLIPRPETEVLVSEALALLPQAQRPRALDSRLTLDEAASLLDAQALRSRVAAGWEANDAAGAVPGDAAPAVSEAAAGAGLDDASGGVSGGSSGTLGVSSAVVGPAHSECLLVADVCTGSGCIACSLAFEHPLVQVVATDLSPDAVALAVENASALGLADRVEVLACDLGQGVDSQLMGAFDLVVSNPPYIPSAVMEEIPREVADFEPALALDGGLDGLDLFRRLLPWCARALKPGGACAFELHETCLDAAAQLARAAGFSDVRIVNDLAGRPRVLTARWKGKEPDIHE